LLDYGATLQQLLIPDAAGELADVVLGYDSIAGYESADNGYHEDDHRQTWQSY
jgi:aldose 1-epimerase